MWLTEHPIGWRGTDVTIKILLKFFFKKNLKYNLIFLKKYYLSLLIFIRTLQLVLLVLPNPTQQRRTQTQQPITQTQLTTTQTKKEKKKTEIKHKHRPNIQELKPITRTPKKRKNKLSPLTLSLMNPSSPIHSQQKQLSRSQDPNNMTT